MDITEIDEMAERLIEARTNAGYETAKDAADAFDWNEVTYRSHESGARGIRKTVAEKYAAAFRVSAIWLLTGEGVKAAQSAEIVSIWSRIPREHRETAKNVLKGFAKKD